MAARKEVMLWNADLTASVRATKIRSVSIIENNTLLGVTWVLKGWFSKNDDFEFGIFQTKQQAIDYAKDELIPKIEGKK